MLIFCNGMPRSASTWSFNVIKAVLRRRFPDEPIEAGRGETPVQFLRSAIPHARHIVMKCHSLTPLGRTLARTGAAKAIFTLRDLPDAVISAMTSFKVDFDKAVGIVAPSLELHAFHCETGNAAIVHYTDIVERSHSAVQKIADYLVGSPVTTQLIEDIAEQTSFERMRRRVEEINVIDDSGLDADSFEPETMLHRNHMDDGLSGKGRAMLSAAQLERLDALARQYTISV